MNRARIFVGATILASFGAGGATGWLVATRQQPLSQEVTPTPPVQSEGTGPDVPSGHLLRPPGLIIADESRPSQGRSLGPKIHLEAIHFIGGIEYPRQLVVRGTLGGRGELELNPNILTLDAEWQIRGSTLVGTLPIPVELKAAELPQPTGRVQRVYDIVPIVGRGRRGPSFSLVLSPSEFGPHTLLVREVGQVVGAYPLVDPDRREQLRLKPELARAPGEEKQAIEALRDQIGYSFRFRLEREGAVTFLYFPEAGDIGRFNIALAGLKNLLSLSFNGGRLGPEGLSSIRHMSSLRGLDFTDSDIDNAGLACVQSAPQLTSMSFFGSRGLTDAGLAHFRNLEKLKLLDLRNENFTATEPNAPRITDAGLKHLAGLTELEYLNLQGQHITDEGLKSLRGMTNLEHLSLSFSGITDEGLKHLEGLKKLRRLHLYGTRVTPDGWAALKAKLPAIEQW